MTRRGAEEGEKRKGAAKAGTTAKERKRKESGTRDIKKREGDAAHDGGIGEPANKGEREREEGFSRCGGVAAAEGKTYDFSACDTRISARQ